MACRRLAPECSNAGLHLLDDRGLVVGLLQIEVVLEKVDDRQVGDVPPIGDTAPLQPEPALSLPKGQVLVRQSSLQLVQQPRLANARLAANEDDLPTAVSGRGVALEQDLQLTIA